MTTETIAHIQSVVAEHGSDAWWSWEVRCCCVRVPAHLYTMPCRSRCAQLACPLVVTEIACITLGCIVSADHAEASTRGDVDALCCRRAGGRPAARELAQGSGQGGQGHRHDGRLVRLWLVLGRRLAAARRPALPRRPVSRGQRPAQVRALTCSLRLSCIAPISPFHACARQTHGIKCKVSRLQHSLFAPESLFVGAWFCIALGHGHSEPE